MSALNARKAAFEQAIRLGLPTSDLAPELRWTAADGRELEEEVERAKRGLLFLCMKNTN
jgi:RNA exonuclease 1